MKEEIRKVIYSPEFEEYLASIDEQLRKKYEYALEIVRTQYVVSTKIVKNLENTDFMNCVFLSVPMSTGQYCWQLTTTISYRARLYFFSTRS